MTDDGIERTLARYREAGLAGADLAEIEDHLRELAADLRDVGMPAALAVAEAARRLGEPRALAHEHARARPPFGPKLPRARAWSAAVPIIILIVWGAISRVEHGRSILAPDLVLGTVVVAALVARLAWARGILLGALAYGVVSMTPWFVLGTQRLVLDATFVGWLGLQTSALVFLAPWRRGELTAPAIALASQVWAFQTALLVLAVASPVAGFAYVTLGAAVVACCGIVLRARWSALAAAASAVALAATFEHLWHTGGAPSVRAIVLATVVVGIAAALLSTVLAWRAARSRLGTFDAVLG